jgi:uncharacterized protein
MDIVLTDFLLSRYHSKIMSEHLPEFIDPAAFAGKRRKVRGGLPLSKMPRLAESLMNTDGEVKVDLGFAREGRNLLVSGTIEAGLVLRCECCLQALEWPVAVEVSLGVVQSIDEANLLPEHLDPLLLEEDRVAVADIVQDELILAIPTIPQHPHCEPPTTLQTDMPEEALPEERPNPFRILSDFKKTNL